MGEWSLFTLNEFEWEVLKLYIKHGHWYVKLYNTSFFTSSLTDDTVCMTLKEFAVKAVDYDDFPWMYKDEQALKQMGE